MSGIQSYARWLERIYLRFRGIADPEAPSRVARIVIETIMRVGDVRVTNRLIGILPVLPQTLSDALIEQGITRGVFSGPTASARYADKHIFDAADYWQGLRSAMLYQPATLISAEGIQFDVRAVCVFNEPRRTAVALVFADGIVFDIDWRVSLFGSAADITNAVLAERRRLELTVDETSHLIGELVASHEERRIEITDKIEAALPSSFYRSVYIALASGTRISSQDLVPPNPEMLPTWLGFRDGITDPDDAAAVLLERVGLETAIIRWSGLPCPLPGEIVANFLAHDNVDDLFRRLLRTPGSPMSAIHLLHLASHLGGKRGRRYFLLLQRKVLDQMRSGEFNRFHQILGWLSVEYSRAPSFLAASPRVALSALWAHTHEIFRLLLNWGATVESLSESFQQRLARQDDALFSSCAFLSDVSHPSNVSSAILCASGLASALMQAGADPAPELQTQLNELLIEADALSPHAYFGLDGDDALQSFLALPRADALKKLLPERSQQIDLTLSPRYPIQQVEQLRSAPTKALAEFVGARLPLALLSRAEVLEIRAALADRSWDELREQDEASWCYAIIAFARLASLREPTIQDAVRDRLASILDRNESVTGSTLSAIVVCFQYLSRSDDPRSTVSRYSTDLKTILPKGAEAIAAAKIISETLKHRLPARNVTPDLAELIVLTRLY